MGDKNTELKNQVIELLNQIIILTKDIEEPQTYEDYNYQQTYVTQSELKYLEKETIEENDIDPSKVNDDEVYLYCVGQYAKRVIDGHASSAAHNENQYYNSNC